MARQDLKLRRAAVVLQEFKGSKPKIDEIVNRLTAEGIIDSGPDAVQEWLRVKARKVVEKVRRFDNLEGTGKVEMISLYEFLDNGSKVEYWKHIEDCNINEAVQHLTYWNKVGRAADRRFHYYFKKFSSAFERRAIQRRLGFDIPDDPDSRPAEGAA